VGVAVCMYVMRFAGNVKRNGKICEGTISKLRVVAFLGLVVMLAIPILNMLKHY
jgi:hypothetical protein